ncbi:MAG: PQQ-binding-like beta-propeller repeat protein, partial [Gammaproteobacteria bacterium]|nr:PQQ-binding-like beta-propeller repeat protein [Gammaproteobacteria bacterium]
MNKSRGISNAALAAVLIALALIVALALSLTSSDDEADDAAPSVQTADLPQMALVDDARVARATTDEPGSWLTYGQTFEEQRFSQLSQINRETVAGLKLAWLKHFDIRHRLQNTPLVVDGTMYVSDPWNVTYALDARTGEQVWRFDPQVDRESVRYACCTGPMTRGLAVYRGKVYIAAFDGRVIAVDAAHGTKVWEFDTQHPSSVSPFTISGAPRVGGGKVYIGQSSSEFGVRGYVTALHAETGELAWRFYLVPGDPSQPYEHPELQPAAATWSGEWWKLGGGGTVWNSIVYDADFNTVYLGVGNGAPWPRVIRSPGGGDNLYLTSIVAVDPDTGRMKWHYQTTPADNWDYTATQDMVLADMEVDGVARKVLLQAPKNGFFYVIDRADGALLRAHPYGRVTWASHVDMQTGRPVENPDFYYEENPQWIWPGRAGAHNWQA